MGILPLQLQNEPIPPSSMSLEMLRDSSDPNGLNEEGPFPSNSGPTL